MAERVRSQRSGSMDSELEAKRRVDIPVNSDLSVDSTNASQRRKMAVTIVKEAFIEKGNSFNEEAIGSQVRPKLDAVTSSSAVGGVISTLLAIASKRLKVGGRLVFFLPHRDLDRAADILHQERIPECLEESVRMNHIPVALSKDTTAIAGMNFSDINLKMAKRKAFRKRMNKGSEGVKNQGNLPIESDIVMASPVSASVDASECHLSGAIENPPILLPTTVPLKLGKQSFLPPLPSNLVLLASYQQMMSPSFSRWLCVVEKRA